MKLHVLIVSCLYFLMFSCASTSEVLYDYNLDVNFDNYDTYVLCVDDFFVENAKHPKIDNEEIRQIIGDAVSTQMELLDHRTNVFNPQLQAGFRIAIEEETAEFTNCEHSDELEYWETCQIHEEVYEKETLVAYVADYKNNKILWQASIPCHLNKSKKKLRPYVNELVAKLFETYPKSPTGQQYPDEKKETY